MNYNPYPQYKSSGVEWLGDVPEHWRQNRVKFAFWLSRGVDLPTENFIEGPYPVYASNGIIGYHNEFTTKGPCVIVGRSGSVGEVNYVEKHFWAHNTALFIQEFRKVIPRFSYYLLIVLDLKSLSAGSAVGTLNRNYIHDVPIAFPPLPEQQAIAAYLDRETGRIDTLVAKKKRLVELLREKRTALISRAVTKGLDLTVKMKPSGVEWLGDVPEHWMILKIRRCAARVQTGNTPPTVEVHYYQDGTVPWFGPSSFSDTIHLSEPVKLINKQAIVDGAARLFTAGTVMIVGIGATIGKVSSINYDASCNQQITGITFKKSKIDTIYVTYQLKQLEQTIRTFAPSATLAIFDQNRISDLWIALPPLPEQQAIASFLDRETGKIDALIAKVESAIEKLKEYRGALISAAVTGKIDVREC